MSLWRWLLQIVLIVMVGFFGYHYFTRPELHQCVSIPLSSLNGRTQIELDQEKVDLFMERFTQQMRGVASQSGALLNNLSSLETSAEADGDWREQLLDQGQYLYCRAVVEKVEQADKSWQKW